MKRLLPLFLVGLSSVAWAAPAQLLVEAESFREPGGWVLDTQFIDSMGSPYLMAHGLGQAVKDATTQVQLPGAGIYKVWVRTKDWVARWEAPGAPGRFQLLINGQQVGKDLGTEGAEWHWQEAGTVEIKDPKATLTLHDLTGFNGRCDAIYFGKVESGTAQMAPPNGGEELAKWRLTTLGLPEKPVEAGEFDLVVAGGGYAGLGAAISAARMGLKVALIQNRPVLGGNGSSEVRVWAMGGMRRGLFPKLGEIVEEFTDHAKSSPGTKEEFGDDVKEQVVRAEKNISLFLNHHVSEVEMKNPAHIAAVVAFDTRTSERRRFSGKFFVDCTGHASVGAQAGAALSLREKEHLGMSNMWRWAETETQQIFPETPWALPLKMEDFPYPRRFHGEWFWESGFDIHPIYGLEETRDWNLRAVFGAFNAMKNGEGRADHANAKLEWVAYVGGTRESRQLLGDVVLTREDITEKKVFDDGTVPTTWDIDLHYPKEQYAVKFPENPFISKAVFGRGVDRQHGYPVPYRTMYSKNIENLFMAGRNVSVTHEALGTVRVMKTGGMIGEVVGKAASICVKHQCTPREVYSKHLAELKELLNLPGVARRETPHAEAVLPADYKPMAPPVDKKEGGRAIRLSDLPGIVVDDDKAKLSDANSWTTGHGLDGFAGEGYRYRSGKSLSTATFEATLPKSGRYEVRFRYQAHENRAANAPVRVESADGAKTISVDQRKEAPNGSISLGVFNFTADKPAVVVVGDGPAQGNVHVDAVQFLPQP